ncbi:DUF3016 domain-containing protein [Piscinibacter sp.]|uniref:DUF3016 domain-containing protein n=1 Tax=Piscinibacter sp. TaxID=1903157 RepID=UPI0039E31E44
MSHQFSRLAAAGLLAAAAATAGAAEFSVGFVHPETYTDAGYSRSPASERDRAEVMHDIEQHLQRLAERSLPAGDTLRIEVLDIDLAGHFEPFRFRGADVRIVRDIAAPRIKLRYTLSRGGQVAAQAEERLTDLSFLMGFNRYPASDRLRYEKAMLDDWFDKRFAAPQ